MLPTSRLGTTKTLALPAMGLPGAFEAPTEGTRASHRATQHDTRNRDTLAEPTETLAESSDKPDVKTYEDSPETPTDERTEGTAAKDVPFSVFVACITRISDLTTQLHDCEKMSEGIRREIAELEAFIN